MLSEKFDTFHIHCVAKLFIRLSKFGVILECIWKTL